MVPHRWMIEAMKMAGIADNIVNLFENSKETWRTELIVCNESLGEVVRRGIFQGDSFSPLLFAAVLIPLSIILNEIDLGYVTRICRNQKLNHHLLMDDLMMYAKSEITLDSLIQTVRNFSDVGMVFGLGKCAVLVLKRRKMVRTEGTELSEGKRMRELNLDKYKYLRVLQLDSIVNREKKEKVKSKYIRRVKKLLISQLNGGNVIAGMNAWAVGIIRYGAGVLHWTKEEFKIIDIKT